MSFTLSFFASPAKFRELMRGRSRRIVMLADTDIVVENLKALSDVEENTPFGVIVAADRSSLCSSTKAELVDLLAAFDNVEWVGTEFNFDRLSASARRCRRRLLRISRRDLDNAFENDEFVLRYQPKVVRSPDNTWLTLEAEALVRWHSPEHGLIGPLEFLPEIEAFGLMGELSKFVLLEAAEQLAGWQANGIELNSCINLSSSQLNEPDLASTYATIVGDVGLDCSRFTFEVIEQDLSDADAPHLRTLRELRARGFRICLDDFRVATSSLGTFEHLPLDEIKIHASALKRAQLDKVALTVLAAVTGLAHNLGISVCAEGVENEETYQFLRQIDCDKMQGFLISEAVLPNIIRRVYSSVDQNADEVA